MRDIHYPGRTPAYSVNGMVATSHPAATLSGLDILRKGGNAIDAAISAAAVLAVVESHSTGIGGDLFCLYAPSGKSEIIALNGSGQSPLNLNLDYFLNNGLSEIGIHSAHSVTIPGAVASWVKLNHDYGKLPLKDVLADSIRYAEEGYVVADVVADVWKREHAKLSLDKDCAKIFLKQSNYYSAGDLHFQPQLADTLRNISENGRDGFYTGNVAQDIVKKLNSLGGVHTLEDFAIADATYVKPIKTTYRGYDVFECPPNGQGITALIMLNILSGYDLSVLDPLSPDRFHLEAEASRLAFRIRDDYIGDPEQVDIPLDYLLSDLHTDKLREKISKEKLVSDIHSQSDFPDHKDTVYLCVVDKDRNAVSLINSLFHPFGSGILSPESGVLLHNRGISFSLNKDKANVISGGKRPMHTIIPSMLVKEGKAIMPFGVMGAHYQPVGQVHFLTNVLDYNMDIQEALDFPRAFNFEGSIKCERSMPKELCDGLREKGHIIETTDLPHGGGQAILIDHKKGMLIGGSDPRKDGVAIGY